MKPSMSVSVNKEKMAMRKKRIQGIPRVLKAVIDAKLKRDAIGVIKTYQSGLKKDAFGLKRLKDATILKKQRQGLPLPEVPLYGYGDREKNSYYNMFYIQKIKDGYRVKPRWAKHHSSKLKLRDLFTMHEYGTVITTKHATIRIPPRPAGARAYVAYVKSINAKTDERAVRLVINRYVETGKVERSKGLANVEDIARSFPKYANPN